MNARFFFVPKKYSFSQKRKNLFFHSRFSGMNLSDLRFLKTCFSIAIGGEIAIGIFVFLRSKHRNSIHGAK